MKTIKQIISDNLSRLRRGAGFRTQESFAEAADIPFRTYQDIERGKSLPRPETLAKIASRLRVSEADIFLDSDSKAGATVESLSKIIEDQERRIRELETGQKLDIPEDILQALPKLSEDGLMALRAVIQGDLGSRKVPKTGSKTQSTSK